MCFASEKFFFKSQTDQNPQNSAIAVDCSSVNTVFGLQTSLILVPVELRRKKDNQDRSCVFKIETFIWAGEVTIKSFLFVLLIHAFRSLG